MSRRFGVWLPAIGWALLIAWSSDQPQWPALARPFPDWMLHGSVFGILAAAVFFGHSDGLCRIRRRSAMLAVALTSMYGIVDELHQSFVPGRDAAVGDWIADSVGAVVVALLLAMASFAGVLGVWED